jgi:hypothetical protein
MTIGHFRKGQYHKQGRLGNRPLSRPGKSPRALGPGQLPGGCKGRKAWESATKRLFHENPKKILPRNNMQLNP